ncbi:hypothetical protein BH23CHL2_BH23CHL2_01660 [soil metagenome]
MGLHIASSYRLTIILAVAVMLGLAWALIAGIGQTRGQDELLTTDTALLTTNRDGLRVCVETLAPDDMGNQQIQGKVRGALNKIRATHPDFEAAGLGRAPVDVATGCPGDPTIFDPDFDIFESRGGTPLLVVDEPSEYRTFIYIATEEQMDEAFLDPNRYPRRVPREVLCEEVSGSTHGCLSVTTSLYLTANELNDLDFLERSLMHSIGLWPVDEAREGVQYPIDPRGK